MIVQQFLNLVRNPDLEKREDERRFRRDLTVESMAMRYRQAIKISNPRAIIDKLRKK